MGPGNSLVHWKSFLKKWLQRGSRRSCQAWLSLLLKRSPWQVLTGCCLQMPDQFLFSFYTEHGVISPPNSLGLRTTFAIKTDLQTNGKFSESDLEHVSWKENSSSFPMKFRKLHPLKRIRLGRLTYQLRSHLKSQISRKQAMKNLESSRQS